MTVVLLLQIMWLRGKMSPVHSGRLFQLHQRKRVTWLNILMKAVSMSSELLLRTSMDVVRLWKHPDPSRLWIPYVSCSLGYKSRCLTVFENIIYSS